MAACLLAWPVHAAAPEPPRVVLITVDGLRRCDVTVAGMPFLATVARTGTMARAVADQPSLTVANHVSFVTGLLPQQHLLRSNWVCWWTRIEPPTIFDGAHACGLRTALYLSKSMLRVLAGRGGHSRVVITNTGRSDRVVAAVLADLAAGRPAWDLALVHLSEPDIAGHRYGWGSANYAVAVATADYHLARIVRALMAGTRPALILVSSDHGGVERGHTVPVPAVLEVPWIAIGPGIRAVTLDGDVHPEDTAATLLAWLGVPLLPRMTGHPVVLPQRPSETAAPMPGDG